MASNKVKYGLRNLHYALVTETTNTSGVTTSSYGDVKPWIGAVSANLSVTGSKTVTRADDSDYFVTFGEGGYEGELTAKQIPEEIKTAVLGYRKDDNGILVEDSSSFSANTFVALMFEFQGDAHSTKHVLYKCSLSRPSISSQTTGENGAIEPQDESLTITAVPRVDADRLIHAETGDTTDADASAAWYTAVPVPTFTPPNDG